MIGKNPVTFDGNTMIVQGEAGKTVFKYVRFDSAIFDVIQEDIDADRKKNHWRNMEVFGL